jgi:hypothetical protein
VDPSTRTQIEEQVRRYGATYGRDFPSLRASGDVDLVLLRLGARRHPVPSMRWRCLTLLDHLDGDDSVPVFVEALFEDPVPRVRRHALHALSCERCKEAPLCVDLKPLLERCAQTDDNERVRTQARAALAALAV